MKNLVALGILFTCVIFDNYLIQIKERKLGLSKRAGQLTCHNRSSTQKLSSLSELEQKMKIHGLLRKSCL